MIIYSYIYRDQSNMKLYSLYLFNTNKKMCILKFARSFFTLVIVCATVTMVRLSTKSLIIK